MPSLRTKYAFNLALTVAVIYTLQVVETLAESFPDFISVTGHLKNVPEVSGKGTESFEENYYPKEELNHTPWSSNNERKSVYILPMLGKRNLEHLAKSSGGYLKHIQNESNDKDKREDADQVTKIIGKILGKNKRGVHILAKNKDFPRNDDKMPKMKEVSIGTFMYTYRQRSADFSR